MKRANGRKMGRGWQALVYVAILALVLGVLSGCDEAGAGGGDDSTTEDGGGDDSTGNGGSDASTSLDLSTLVLHLGFDGDLSDETGTSSDMIVLGDSGSAAGYGEDRHGATSGAIEFDGSYAMKVDDIDLSSSSSITVTAWIRDDGSATTTERWIAAYVSSGPSYEFALRIRKLTSVSWEDGSFETFVENSGSNGTRTTEYVFPGSWVHIAMVYDKSDEELRLYQNGVRKNSRILTGDSLDPLNLDSGNLLIGGGNGDNDDFHGRIDDLAIFTRALSDEEVALAKDQIGTN